MLDLSLHQLGLIISTPEPKTEFENLSGSTNFSDIMPIVQNFLHNEDANQFLFLAKVLQRSSEV